MPLRFLAAFLLILPAAGAFGAPACKTKHHACATKSPTAVLPAPPIAKPAQTNTWGGAYLGVSGGAASTQNTIKP